MSKWVWDEWEEDDAEQRSLGSSITESTLGTPAILARGTAPPPARDGGAVATFSLSLLSYQSGDCLRRP